MLNHSISLHFIERIDEWRQYFYFLYVFYGITGKERHRATFLDTDLDLLLPLTLQGLGFFWLPMVGGARFDPLPPSKTLAEISDTDAIHLKLGTLIL